MKCTVSHFVFLNLQFFVFYFRIVAVIEEEFLSTEVFLVFSLPEAITNVSFYFFFYFLGRGVGASSYGFIKFHKRGTQFNHRHLVSRKVGLDRPKKEILNRICYL